jgi:hypothetical protein
MRTAVLLGAIVVLLCSVEVTAQAQEGVVATELSWGDMLRLDARAAAIEGTSVVRPRLGLPDAPRGIAASQGPMLSALPGAGAAEAAPVPRPVRTASTPSPVLDFDGLLDNTHVIPPDTYGSVGPSHVVTMLNSDVLIQNKAGGQISKVSLASFWSSIAKNSLTDPHIQYDPVSGRWYASIAFYPDSSASGVALAVSATNDPTGGWRFFTSASGSTTYWPDYPQLGYNNRWIVISGNMFNRSSGVSNPGAFRGPGLWIFDKVSALASSGSPTVTRLNPGFDAPNRGFTMQPMQGYSPNDTLYVVEVPGYFASSDTTFLLRLSRITGTGTSPSWGTLPTSFGSGFVRVANNFNGSQIDGAQLGSAQTIDAGDSRAAGAVFRNGRLWFTHSAGLPAKIRPTPTRTAAFWYQISPQASNPILQSGVIDPGTGGVLAFPSIAVNKLDDACIGFSRMDASRYAEGAYTVRQSADAPGTTQGVVTLKAGNGPYFKTFGGGRNRWGDFSNTCVDPSDSMAFWTIQEYADTPSGSGDGSGRWATHWGKILIEAPLPVQLVSFQAARVSGGSVDIIWKTATEVNCYGFQLERSAGTTDNFTLVAGSFTHGQGTTVEPHTYAFVDAPPGPGRFYYRLDQIDLDGTVHVHDPVAVDAVTGAPLAAVPIATELMQNFPNPFNPTTDLRFRVSGSGLVTLVVHDLLGREVAVLVNEPRTAGEYTVQFDARGLPSGMYVYQLRTGTTLATKRMMLVK